MSNCKSIFSDQRLQPFTEGDSDERQAALEFIAEAWNAAEDEGISCGALAHSSLFAALVTLVRLHGEEAVAQMMTDLPSRLQAGEYNIDRQLQ